MLGISADDAESHRDFIKKYQIPFTLLCDPDHKVMSEYGAYGKKKLYGIPTTGVIRSSVWIGPDGVVKKHWAKVADAGMHPAQALETLQAASK